LLIHAERFDDSPELLKFLLRGGADPNAANEKGRTPRMAAASQNNIGDVRSLIEGGAKRSATNNAGETALDLARKRN
jgi:ankyrin repeat protein